MSKKNTAATIATIIVAVLAIATTLFLLYQTSQQQIQENQYNYVPSDEVNEEMNMNAVTLIKNNCEVFRIYLQYGLPHQAEPYNNVPEDGYYTVKSENYKTFSDIETLVNSTFVEKEAKRILTNITATMLRSMPRKLTMTETRASVLTQKWWMRTADSRLSPMTTPGQTQNLPFTPSQIPSAI